MIPASVKVWVTATDAARLELAEDVDAWIAEELRARVADAPDAPTQVRRLRMLSAPEDGVQLHPPPA